jgi:hypothetical protein
VRLPVRFTKAELFFWSLFSLLACIPFLFAEYLPVTDLSQHLCRIRLFLDHGHNQQFTKSYVINWSGANALAYLLLGVDWLLFSPVAAGKALMLQLALASVLFILFIAPLHWRMCDGAGPFARFSCTDAPCCRYSCTALPGCAFL